MGGLGVFLLSETKASHLFLALREVGCCVGAVGDYVPAPDCN